MYDEYARQLIDLLPDLPEIDRVACRRALSTAYFYVVRSRLKLAQDDIENADLDQTQRLLRRMADALESIAVFDRLHGQTRSKEVENACAFVAAESLALLANLAPPLGTAIDAYLDWLGGYEENGLETATSILQTVRHISTASGYPGYTTFADIYHLSSLLLAAIERTRQHSLIHTVPPPQGADENFLQQFHEYLQHRARGDENDRGRPLLWQSSLEYVTQCLPGPEKDAVISMPTGSGKSFIAELAIGHALCSGWILYLAPTNALVHQIRHDLKYALEPFGVSLRTFVGNEEYTTLIEEQITLDEENFIAVMTPEKCALALRLHPERFTRCSLCVFDECHLLQDRQRGVTSDMLIAQLSIIAPNIGFILMSAMVSNPDDLAGWLHTIRDTSSLPITVKWRPSRTMRGFLIVEPHSFSTNYNKARKQLKLLPEHRVRQKFDVNLALLVCLSGPWTLSGPPDYRRVNLPVIFQAQTSQRTQGKSRKKLQIFEGWKNTASRLLAELFAKSGISVICFILSSRHHTFSNAENVSGEIPGAIRTETVFQALANFPPLVEAWLSIAEHELGVETALRELLLRGIAVHHSAMLQPEQTAAEWMFSQRKARVMFATGTLAQGLNLPATAVVIAGTSRGDSREEEIDKIAGISDANTMILNSFGRAGRPGFSNQGIAVLVSDKAYTQQTNPTDILNSYTVLGEPDATEDIHSPIETFLDTILAGDIDITRTSENERILTSLLAEYDEEEHHAGHILSRTLAAYHKRNVMTPQVTAQIRARVDTVKQALLQQPDVPEWINNAAMKAGVDFFRAHRMWKAYEQHGIKPFEESATFEITDWLGVFFEVMALLPPKQIERYLEREDIKRDTVLTRMRDLAARQRNCDTVPWNIPDTWTTEWQKLRTIVLQYMQGLNYAKIAELYLGVSPNQITSGRSSGAQPIPTVFSFLQKVVNPLSIDAGCFLAIYECIITEKNEGKKSIPETLQALPLCIRNGCDSLGTLSWYRFGYRQRVCAHILEQTFPVPKDLKSDTKRAEWVRRTRHDWLSGELNPKDLPVLDYVKTVLLETAIN